MTIAYNIAGLIAVALTTSAAAAVQAAQVTPFDGVSLQGGGEVTIRPGARHGYRILAGSAQDLVITSERNRGLRIRCLSNACQSAKIEVTAPRVTALAVSGGGLMRVASGYAPQRSIAVAVNGGGQIDTRAMNTTDVAASVSGGGSILTHARSSLAASVRGGGSIIYTGAPQVATSIQGGGSVHRAGDRG